MRNATASLACIVVVAIAIGAVRAQRLAFEVVSVKLNKSGNGQRLGGPRPGRFEQTNITLRQLIQMAYRRRGFDLVQMSGGPSWIDGGVGNDLIQAKNGVKDNIACGDGADSGLVDFNDLALPFSNCEVLTA